MDGYRETQEWRDIPHRDKNEEIVIRFVIEYQNADQRLVHSVAAEIFRATNPLELYRVQNLKFDQNIKFHHVFSRNHAVHGWLRWRTGLHVSYGQQIVGRVEIGSPGEPDYWNYDGFMIGFGARPQPIPDVPKPEPEVLVPGPLPSPQGADAMAIADAHLEMTELFPFIYIKPWPKLANNFADQRFMLVPTDVTTTGFYTKLAGSTGQQKSLQAVAFIDDTLSPTPDGVYTGQFLAPTQPLPPPFANFLDFPLHLRLECSDEGLNRWVRETFTTWDDLATALQTPEASTTLINIWNSAIALMITTGYDHAWLSTLMRVLQVTHLIDGVLAFRRENAEQNIPALSSRQLTRMIQSVMVLPDDIFPVFGLPDQPVPPTVQPYAVGAIRTVHYKPERYTLGDVQRIEIVIAGETRQEINRNLRHTETGHDEHNGSESSNASISDTTTVDLVNQVQKTLSDRVSATTVNNYQTDYGQPNTNTMKVTGNWWVQDQPAGGYLKDISKFTRDVVDRSVKALRHQTMQRRKSRVYEEAETTETRTLSNAGESGDRQTVFRWVNRQYQLQTKASEDRLVFEIFLDAPGSNLLQAISKHCNIEIVPPVPPEQAGIKSYKDLSPDVRSSTSAPGSVYYLDAFEIYGIPPDDDAPPATRVVTTGLMSRNPVSDTCLDIPPGYSALSATATVTSVSEQPQVQVVVGGIGLTAAQTGTLQTFKGDLSAAPARYASQLWASILCFSPPPASPSETGSAENNAAPVADTAPKQGTTEFETFYAFTLQVQCVRSPATLANWQMATYQKIQAAYKQALAHYNFILGEHRKMLETKNPRLLADVVQDKIIQSAIALFAGVTRAKAQNAAEETASRDFEPRYAQFLRNAFDWDGMAVELFDETDKSLYLNEGQSALLSLFSSSGYLLDFLQARQARLMLSVKPDFARTLLLAFRTGEIWPCGEDIAPCTAADMNIVELLLEQRNTPSQHTEDHWTITVPTEMVALSRHDPFL